MQIVDFHAHYADPSWPALPPPSRPLELAQAWQRISERIGDFDGVLHSLTQSGLDVRVLGAPPALLAPAGKSLPASAIVTINDRLAERVAAHRGRLLGLATIDAFQGDSAADEACRAIELGLSGFVVDCQHDDLLLDAPEARPLLETASVLGAPVFVHPISPVRLSRELEPLGRLGVSIARGTADAARPRPRVAGTSTSTRWASIRRRFALPWTSSASTTSSSEATGRSGAGMSTERPC